MEIRVTRKYVFDNQIDKMGRTSEPPLYHNNMDNKEINTITNLFDNEAGKKIEFELQNYPESGKSTKATISQFIHKPENDNLVINCDDGKKRTITQFRFCELAGLITRDPNNRHFYTTNDYTIGCHLGLTIPRRTSFTPISKP